MMANEGMKAVHDALRTLSTDGQRENFVELAARRVIDCNGSSSSNQENNLGSCNDSSSSDDVEIIDISDTEDEEGADNEFELMEVSSETSSTGSRKGDIAHDNQGLDPSLPTTSDDVVVLIPTKVTSGDPNPFQDASRSDPIEINETRGENASNPEINVTDDSDMDDEQSEEESDRDWQAITIDDDDEFYDNKPKEAPKEMICYRCPDKKTGAFKDERKYWAHLKRHLFADHFACATCQRPFIKLNYCLSHELRVHGTPLPADMKDSVISLAKSYIRTRPERKRRVVEVDQNPQQEDSDTDCEDVQFYENRFVNSTTIYPYRGLKVNTMLEAYEIQHLSTRRKQCRANALAKLAIDVHKQNVQKKQDVYRLGRFSNKKPQSTKFAPAPPAPKKSDVVPPVAPLKRPRNVVSDTDKSNKKPKPKRVRYQYMSSSSSSSSGEDSDCLPEASDPIPSTSSQKPVQRKQPKVFFTALLKRNCVLCNYEWETENDLRLHRDSAHKDVPLLDLMTFPLAKNCKAALCTKKSKAAVKLPQVQIKDGSKKKEPKKPAPKRKSKNSPAHDGPPKKKRAVRKGRSKVPRRPVVPPPDASFTEKEHFLSYFELTNRFRLHVHQKKPVEALPQCRVVLEKMSNEQVAMYQQNKQFSSLLNFLPPHFLLG